jgi:hypothetical protein
MAPIFNIAFFWHLFLGALIFVRNFYMLKCLHILEEQTQKKIVAEKLNSKWPLNSRWLSKLNLLVKTTNNLISTKKNCRKQFILKNSTWSIFFELFFLGALIVIRNFKMLKFLHILEKQTKKKKIKKFVAKELNSKWSLKSRWLPNLNLTYTNFTVLG